MFSPQKICVWGNAYVKLLDLTILQCIRISKHNAVHHKYLHYLLGILKILKTESRFGKLKTETCLHLFGKEISKLLSITQLRKKRKPFKEQKF